MSNRGLINVPGMSLLGDNIVAVSSEGVHVTLHLIHPINDPNTGNEGKQYVIKFPSEDFAKHAAREISDALNAREIANFMIRQSSN